MINARTPNIALETLKSILDDARYFVENSEHRVSQALKPQIDHALSEIKELLEPIEPLRLKQIISRLTLHFSCPSEIEWLQMLEKYAQKLAHYPEDLISTAYVYIVKHAKGIHMPPVSELIAFIEPEFLHRKETQRKLGILKAQSETTEEVSHEPA